MRYKGHTILGQAALIGSNWEALERECAKHHRFVIEVRKYDEAKEISLAQMAWLHCENGPIAVLANDMGISRLMAETILKVKCGAEWFLQEIDGREIVASKTSLSVTQTTKWIENIFDFMEKIGSPVEQPNPEWRQTKAESECPF